MNMNRTIKFRVWQKEFKQFLEIKDGFLDFNGNLWYYDVFGELVQIHPARYVIQQFTGLTAKNVEVYEGDILSINLPDKKEYVNGEVIYSREYLTYLVKVYHGKVYYSEYLCDLQNREMDFEVVGNIYENPDVLKWR